MADDVYPILEFDPSKEAMVEPSQVIKQHDVSEHCVICFFKEVIDEIVADKQAKIVVNNHWEDGPHPIFETIRDGRRLAFFHPGVGAALSAGLLEEVIAFGCRKFIVCGGCGVLEKSLGVGHLVVVTGAIRDEGVSYHYLPAGREVKANHLAITTLINLLMNRNLPFQVGKTWTTDAPYRETQAKIAKRREEGCLTVEMEAAALFAVAEFRSVILGQVLYSGDDLSGDHWDNREWQSRRGVRKNLFWLAADACLNL